MDVTKRQQGALNLYADLMEEAKIRLDAIASALNGRTGLISPLVREFVCLQHRLLCELVGLGSLLAHGDIEATQTKKLQREYSPEKIFTELEALHPDFFPHPINKATFENDTHRFEPVKAGFLTKAELIDLYGKSGDSLHKGSLKRLKRLLSPKSPTEIHFRDLAEPTQKLATLLNQHRIALFDGSMMVCLLRCSDMGNRVQVLIGAPVPFDASDDEGQ